MRDIYFFAVISLVCNVGLHVVMANLTAAHNYSGCRYTTTKNDCSSAPAAAASIDDDDDELMMMK